MCMITCLAIGAGVEEVAVVAEVPEVDLAAKEVRESPVKKLPSAFRSLDGFHHFRGSVPANLYIKKL